MVLGEGSKFYVFGSALGHTSYSSYIRLKWLSGFDKARPNTGAEKLLNIAPHRCITVISDFAFFTTKIGLKILVTRS